MSTEQPQRGLGGRVKLGRMMEQDTRPDRSEALSRDELSWSRILAEEPRLKALRSDVKSVEPGEGFCANRVWYGYGFRGRLIELVGWYAPSPRLRSEAAYSVAYDRLYNLLPDCRDCGCM